MNKNKSIRTLYGFASERLCHYFPNVPLNLVNHVNCVPETISSTGWVYYSHNGSYMHSDLNKTVGVSSGGEQAEERADTQFL